MLERFWHAMRRFLGYSNRSGEASPATHIEIGSLPPVMTQGTTSKEAPRAYLMKTEIPPAAITPPRPRIRSVAQLAREVRRREAYEKAFPYEEARQQPPVERVGNRGPEVSGGLPSLGKRRP
jgi:hypothetical protein